LATAADGRSSRTASRIVASRGSGFDVLRAMVAVASSRRWFWFAVRCQVSADRGVWVDGEGVPRPLVLFGGFFWCKKTPIRFQNSSTKSDSTGGVALGKGAETDSEFYPMQGELVLMW
jgi:hypothetical protein